MQLIENLARAASHFGDGPGLKPVPAEHREDLPRLPW
jgi:hypothetical protein